MGFGKFRLPRQIPQKMKDKVAELENTSANSKEYLEAVYGFVTSRWHAGRLTTIYYAPLAFRRNLEKIWDTPGYAHCNTQNYILFVLLAGSKFFQEEDIEPICVFFNFFIHQYLKVKVGDDVIPVDPAGASIRGKPLGEHIKWFG